MFACGIRLNDRDKTFMSLTISYLIEAYTYTRIRLTAFFPGLYPGEPVPER